MARLHILSGLLKLTILAFVAISLSKAGAATTHTGDLNVTGPYLVIGNFTISEGNLTVQNAGTLTVQSGTGEEGDLSIVAAGDATKGHATAYSGGSIWVAGTFSVAGDFQTYSSAIVRVNALTIGKDLVNAGQTTIVTSYTNLANSKIENSGTFITRKRSD